MNHYKELESYVVQEIFLFIPVHMFSPSFLCLSVWSICGIVLRLVQWKKSHVRDHHQEVRIRWGGRQSGKETRRETNKQIPNNNHNLIKIPALPGVLSLQMINTVNFTFKSYPEYAALSKNGWPFFLNKNIFPLGFFCTHLLHTIPWYPPLLVTFPQSTIWWRPKITLFPLPHTFGNAECVVTTGHKIIECDEKVGVILTWSSQQVLFGVPAGRFGQTLTLEVWFLESFWKIENQSN